MDTDTQFVCSIDYRVVVYRGSHVSDAHLFYRARDCRSREYGVEARAFTQPVAILVGDDAAESERGQLHTLALMNMVARLHRHVQIAIPDVPLIAFRALGRVQNTCHTSLRDAAVATAQAIDPFIRIECCGGQNVGFGVGLGRIPPHKVPWYVGARDNLAYVSREPMNFDLTEGFSLGSCLAACVSAWLLFCGVMDRPVRPRVLSAWTLAEGDEKADGPRLLGTLDVGRCLMIGAGGVGSALAYWLAQCGVQDRWLVVDGDRWKLHNANRSLGMVPADAGWPDGEAGLKAETASQLFGATARPCWYDELNEQDCSSDLVLPLANDRGIRTSLSQRGAPILLHATTSVGFEAQVHRHIADRDDCLICRLPSRARKAAFECSTVRIGNDSQSTDASLPFLSATAAVLLLSALCRLSDGTLPREHHNWWRLAFTSTGDLLMSGKRKCSVECPGILPPPARRVAHRGSRWSSLDTSACASGLPNSPVEQSIEPPGPSPNGRSVSSPRADNPTCGG